VTTRSNVAGVTVRCDRVRGGGGAEGSRMKLYNCVSRVNWRLIATVGNGIGVLLNPDRVTQRTKVFKVSNTS
jgi:hypothetical protein